MGTGTDDRTQAEARHEVAVHPDRRPEQDEMIRIYLAGEAYAESHEHPSEDKGTSKKSDGEER